MAIGTVARTERRYDAALCETGVAFGRIRLGQNDTRPSPRARSGPQASNAAAHDDVVTDVGRTEGQSVDVILMTQGSKNLAVFFLSLNSEFPILNYTYPNGTRSHRCHDAVSPVSHYPGGWRPRSPGAHSRRRETTGAPIRRVQSSRLALPRAAICPGRFGRVDHRARRRTLQTARTVRVCTTD